MEMTIGKRFVITSGALLVLSTVLALVSILSLNRIGSNVNTVATHSVPGLYYGTAIRGSIYRLRGDYLRHIASNDPAQKQQIENDIAVNNSDLDSNIAHYEQSMVDNEDRDNFSKLPPLIAGFRQGWNKVEPLSRASKEAEAFQMYGTDMTPSINELKVQLAVIADWNKKRSDAGLAATTQTVQSAWWMTLTAAILSFVLGIGLSWYMIIALNREMTRSVTELSEGAEQIASAASQVSASSQSLAQGSSEQAASLEETSSSSEEINSMARKNTDNSLSMANLVATSQEMFVKTNQQLEEMVVSMDEINQSSGKISKIIKVIDDIAFQTNILALNAAVEAARAGEAGMGFAVVADEVRNLAQRSAQAAKDTALLIEDSISKSNAGKTKVDQVAVAISAITADITKVKTLAEEVSLGSSEQSRGLEQISRAISQMEQVTQTTAANAEESAAAAEELNAQSEALRDVVSRLNAMVGGQEVSRGGRSRSSSLNQSRPSFSGPKVVPSFVSHLTPARPQRAMSGISSNGHDRSDSGADSENESAAMTAFREF